MQAITIAIGKVGIDYFARTIVAERATARLNQMKPPDRVIPVDGFHVTLGLSVTSYGDIVIWLTEGKMEPGYNMEYRGVQQLQSGNQFKLAFHAGPFAESYHWVETYEDATATNFSSGSWHKRENAFDYLPVVAHMDVNPLLTFVYDTATNAYSLLVRKEDNAKMVDVDVSDRGIPKKSILQYQHQKCFASQVTEATAKMIGDIDFTAQINDIFPAIFASIPASGRLPETITYDFALAMGEHENGLQFPGGDGTPGEGITIGVTGAVTWEGQPYEAPRPPDEGEAPVLPRLPVPRVPVAPKDPAAWKTAPFMTVYVSYYEINALYWAYCRAGKLNRTITPGDLASPAILNTATYPLIPALQQYGDRAMHADIQPAKAPIARGQLVYIVSEDDKVLFKDAGLSDAAYDSLMGLKVRAYDSKEMLDAALAKQGIAQYSKKIVEITERKGLVTISKLKFRLVIQYQGSPEILFEVERTDVKTDLNLGPAAFRLTDDSLEKLKKDGVSEDTRNKLAPMKDHTYYKFDDFAKELRGRLNSDPQDAPDLYHKIIESAEYPVQSLQFTFKNVRNKATFTSSTVPGLSEAALGPFGAYIWPIACEPQYATAMNDMGKQGVPIPIMSGFHFVFGEAKPAIENEYIVIEARAKYKK